MKKFLITSLCILILSSCVSDKQDTRYWIWDSIDGRIMNTAPSRELDEADFNLIISELWEQ